MVNMNISKKDIPLLLREKCGDDFEKSLHSPILLFIFVPEKTRYYELQRLIRYSRKVEGRHKYLREI